MGAAADQAMQQFGAQVMLKHLSALEKEIPGVRRARDMECIHRMRVASRRLRSALVLFAPCLPKKPLRAWRGEVRAITRALGAARDLDVQLDLLRRFYQGLDDAALRPGVRRLILRRTQTRRAAQQGVLAAMDGLAAASLLVDLRTTLTPCLPPPGAPLPTSPALLEHASRQITFRLDDLLVLEPCLQHPEQTLELHAMRIAAKRLRYTLEAFAPLHAPAFTPVIAALRELQDSLGDIHDCDVWLASLPGFMEEERTLVERYFGSARPFKRLQPGLDHFAASRAEMRGLEFAALNQRWQELAAAGLWTGLRQIIQVLPAHDPHSPDL
ncbi:MAG TPA: CHAD domain-containing protein [Anaerolineaceae bacterium]|nr:CHAD domain-containing protein [Anaerolineaceae bacterium]HPN50435.1 CHAD domain-containing protein [Anaerolineaceae bacterium]